MQPRKTLHRNGSLEGVGFTPAQLAAALGISSRAVRKRMGAAPDDSLETFSGQSQRAWTWAALPEDWRKSIAAISERKGYRAPEALLLDRESCPWQTPVPFEGVTQRFQDEARQWREAMLPVLGRQHEAAAGELLKLGLAECRRVFSKDVSESTWRRHFDLAVERDRNFQQWGRLDIYLPEEAFQRVSTTATPGDGMSQEDTEGLTDAFTQVANPSHPTTADRDAVFEALVKHGLCNKAAALDYTFKSLPGMSRTRKALGKWFRRKRQQLNAKANDLNLVRDGRPGRSGRKGAKLCPECERIVAGAAVDLDGDLAQAWRRLLLGNKLCQKCSGLWHFDCTGQQELRATRCSQPGRPCSA